MLNNKYIWIISALVLVIILWYVFSSRSDNSEDSNKLKHPVKPKTSNTKLSLDNSVTQPKKSGSKNKLNIDKLNSLS